MFFLNFCYSQTEMVIPEMVKSDSSCNMNSCKYSNIIGFTGKYYFNQLQGVRRDLQQFGFDLESPAYEVQVKFGSLPKLFFYQQTGNLTNSKYASVIGYGMKYDIHFPIFKGKPYIVTPVLELGVGYYKLELLQDVTTNSIKTVINSQVITHKLDNFTASADAGLQVGYGFDIGDRQLSIMAQGGYVIGLPSQWRLANSLAFKETMDLASPYAGISIRLSVCDCSGCKCCSK